MSFVHDVIKIKYAREGYLPDLPYHLISDEEMCDAFINLPDNIRNSISDDSFGITVSKTANKMNSTRWYNAFLKDTSQILYFRDNYPLIDDSISTYYKDLVNRIFYEIQEFKKNPDNEKTLPDWIYSYMLGICIGPNSTQIDIHDMIYSMGTDNTYDEYNLQCAAECLRISIDWLKRIIVPEGEVKRPPTMFGEPHVLKSIRLEQEALDIEDLPSWE